MNGSFSFSTEVLHLSKSRYSLDQLVKIMARQTRNRDRGDITAEGLELYALGKKRVFDLALKENSVY